VLAEEGFGGRGRGEEGEGGQEQKGAEQSCHGDINEDWIFRPGGYRSGVILSQGVSGSTVPNGPGGVAEVVW
jgi:hypothetical protein